MLKQTLGHSLVGDKMKITFASQDTIKAFSNLRALKYIRKFEIVVIVL